MCRAGFPCRGAGVFAPSAAIFTSSSACWISATMLACLAAGSCAHIRENSLPEGLFRRTN
jgi:hypothetical protein